MPDTVTTNLALVKPEVGGSVSSWGGKLNSNLDDLDAAVSEKVSLNGGEFTGAIGIPQDASPQIYIVGNSTTGIGSDATGELFVKVSGTEVARFKQGTGVISDRQLINVLLSFIGSASVEQGRIAPLEYSASEGGIAFYINTGSSIVEVARFGNSGKFNGFGVNNPQGVIDVNGRVLQNVVDMAGGVILDFALGNIFVKTLTANTVFTYANLPPSGKFFNWSMRITNGGAYTWSFPAGFKYPSGVQPTLTVSGRDWLYGCTIDGGTIMDIALNMKGMA